MKRLLKTTFMAMLLLSGSYVFGQPGGLGGGSGSGGPPPGGVGAPIDKAAVIFLLSVACYTYYQLSQRKQQESV